MIDCANLLPFAGAPKQDHSLLDNNGLARAPCSNFPTLGLKYEGNLIHNDRSFLAARLEPKDLRALLYTYAVGGASHLIYPGFHNQLPLFSISIIVLTPQNILN